MLLPVLKVKEEEVEIEEEEKRWNCSKMFLFG